MGIRGRWPCLDQDEGWGWGGEREDVLLDRRNSWSEGLEAGGQEQQLRG